MNLTIETAKKRIYLLGGLAALLILLLVMFLGCEKPVYTFAELSGLQAGEIQGLAIRGDKSEEQFLVEVPETIAEFLDLLGSLNFEKKRGEESELNWIYAVDLFRGETEENFLRLLFTGEDVDLAFYEQGEKKRGETYNIDHNIIPQLEKYFNRVFALQQELSKMTCQEIKPAICVVINNYPAARPSSGLQQADIIYEFLVEGGTTRYLAVYQKKHRENFDIGPIRSLRPYFAVQSLEHGGLVAHSGYSSRTKAMIKGLGVSEIADMGDNFWRDRSRKAPHNLYTSINNLYHIVSGRLEEVERTYNLDCKKEIGSEKAMNIDIDYSAHNKVSYLYDEKEEVYQRYINAKPHTDRETGQQYFAERVIVRVVPHRDVPGPDALVDIELGGSGKGFLYEGGRKYSLTWEKEKKDSETIFYYTDGTLVEPHPGTTWIQIVRSYE